MENNRIIVNLEPQASAAAPALDGTDATSADQAATPVKKRGVVSRYFGWALLVGLVVAVLGGYLWWRNFQTTPAYSLALVVDAARRDDQATLGKHLNTDQVVENFVPQITDKALERYARGFPPQFIQRAVAVLQPVLPIIKDRARVELPRLIKERSQQAKNIPFPILALGIGRAVQIKQTGNTAEVTTKAENRDIVLTMRRDGSRWQIVGVRDEVLADQIANRMAQQLLSLGDQRLRELQRLAASGQTNAVRQQLERLME